MARNENKRVSTTTPKTALLLLLGIDLLLHIAEVDFNLYTVVTMGRLLSTCTTLREWTNVLWAKVAEMFLLPLQPLLTRMPSFNLATVQRIVEKLRGREWDFVGRQRQADVITDLDHVAACSEHNFVTRSCVDKNLCGMDNHFGIIRWKCTHSSPKKLAVGWVTDTVTAERGQGCLTMTRASFTTVPQDRRKYVFDIHHNGMMIVLRDSKVIGPDFSTNADTLRQIAWGVLNLGSMQLVRTEVLPIPV